MFFFCLFVCLFVFCFCFCFCFCLFCFFENSEFTFANEKCQLYGKIDRRAKQRTIWDRLAGRQQNKYRAPLTLWHSCHIGVIRFTCDFSENAVSNCCFWCKFQSTFIRLLLNYLLSGLNKTIFLKFWNIEILMIYFSFPLNPPTNESQKLGLSFPSNGSH